MAIGLGRMMGFEYLRNFNYPYIARSITEFWRRWHISLSTFWELTAWEYWPVFVVCALASTPVCPFLKERLVAWAEGRAYTQAPEMTTEALASGSFQTQTEEALSDHVPMRDLTVLANATLQRSAIEAANIAFNYDCYPTKFGSNYAAIPEHEAVVYTSPSPRKKDLAGVDNWVASVKVLAEAHPDVRFVYDVIDDTYTSEFNPTNKLVSRPWSSDWIQEHVVESLGESVEVLYDPIQSENEFFNQWFHTEHHWTLQRAIASYNRIAETCEWNPVTWENEFEVTSTWYSSSKIAAGVETPLDFGDPPTNAFGTYFGNVKAEVIWENENSRTDKSCLFIGQSYSPALEPFIARNYRTTVCVDPLNTEAKKSFEECIDEYEIDVVVIQLGIRDLRMISANSPSWVQ